MLAYWCSVYVFIEKYCSIACMGKWKWMQLYRGEVPNSEGQASKKALVSDLLFDDVLQSTIEWGFFVFL